MCLAIQKLQVADRHRKQEEIRKLQPLRRDKELQITSQMRANVQIKPKTSDQNKKVNYNG
jgi:hypothetical protein